MCNDLASCSVDLSGEARMSSLRLSSLPDDTLIDA